jgi:hypothetical protein
MSATFHHTFDKQESIGAVSLPDALPATMVVTISNQQLATFNSTASRCVLLHVV